MSNEKQKTKAKGMPNLAVQRGVWGGMNLRYTLYYKVGSVFMRK